MSNSPNAPPAPAAARLRRTTVVDRALRSSHSRSTLSNVKERSAERRRCGCEPHRRCPMTRGTGDACEASPRPSDVGALASRRSTAASSTHRARRLTPEASAPVLMPGGGIPRSPERGMVSPARRRRSPLRLGIPSGRRPHRAGMRAIIPMRGPVSRRKSPKIRKTLLRLDRLWRERATDEALDDLDRPAAIVPLDRLDAMLVRLRHRNPFQLSRRRGGIARAVIGHLSVLPIASRRHPSAPGADNPSGIRQTWEGRRR